MTVRAALCALVAVAVLAGSAALVAERADDAGAQRARLAQLIADEQECGVGCTAGTRAKERIESGLADGDPG